ncbi:MAG: hypothetical protein FJ276_00595 [Planctomycetes bacterium]|nr:hypothetical protein [Planctomycetota bacterium]
MNRFHLPKALPFAEVSPRSLHVEQSVYQTQRRRGFHCAVFAPLHYEQNYAYPLLVWLHGPGEDERQLLSIMPLISTRNYVAVGARGEPAGEPVGRGFTWTQSEAGVAWAEQGVFECLAMAQERFHIARNRVFLGGYQCGGTMAFRIGMTYPARFAGLVSLGGAFPADHTPLACLEQSRRLPLFIAHGGDSTRYPVEKTCEELRLFHAAGMHVVLRHYPCGDTLHPRMLHDMNTWLMEQVTGVQASNSDTAVWQPVDEN